MSLRSKSQRARKLGKMSRRVAATKRRSGRQAGRTDHEAEAQATIAEFSIEQSTEAAQDAELVAVDARAGSGNLHRTLSGVSA
jgi:hypothetical protein